MDHQSKLNKELESAVSYFFIRRVANATELRGILSRKEFKTPAAKLRLLQNQLRHYTLGHNMSKYHKPFSSTKDTSVGTVEDLTGRLKEILALSDLTSLMTSSPKPKHVKSKELPDLGYATAMKQELEKECEDSLVHLTERLMAYNRDYLFPLELKEWELVQPAVWPQELTAFQKKFKRGTRFKIVDEDDGDEQCLAFGMEWDENQKDYSLFYCSPSKKSSITSMSSGDLDYAYFVSTDATEGLDKWAIEFT